MISLHISLHSVVSKERTEYKITIFILLFSNYKECLTFNVYTVNISFLNEVHHTDNFSNFYSGNIFSFPPVENIFKIR